MQWFVTIIILVSMGYLYITDLNGLLEEKILEIVNPHDIKKPFSLDLQDLHKKLKESEISHNKVLDKFTEISQMNNSLHKKSKPIFDYFLSKNENKKIFFLDTPVNPSTVMGLSKSLSQWSWKDAISPLFTKESQWLDRITRDSPSISPYTTPERSWAYRIIFKLKWR